MKLTLLKNGTPSMSFEIAPDAHVRNAGLSPLLVELQASFGVAGTYTLIAEISESDAAANVAAATKQRRDPGAPGPVAPALAPAPGPSPAAAP